MSAARQRLIHALRRTLDGRPAGPEAVLANSMRPFWLALVCGLVPIAVTHAAWMLNLLSPATLLADEFRCIPYWDGCVSVSRAVRSGPGLMLFRALMLPTAALLAITWLCVRPWLTALRSECQSRARWISVTGFIGALFLVLYVSALGTDGPWYGWLRRYGVVVYFGLTALSQLLLVHALWPLGNDRQFGHLHGAIRALFALVCVEWLCGVLSVAKSALLSDPALIDRIENVVEWWFALALSAAFLALAVLMYRSGFRLSPSIETMR
jgi:hypothetical protein